MNGLHKLRLLRILSAVIGLHIICGCSDAANTQLPKSLLFDFGNVAEGEIVTHVFEIANPTDAEVAVTSVTASCGCTAAKPSNHTLPPHTTSEIFVELDTRGKSGQTSARVLVALSDDSTREFNISGYVYNRVLPPLDFGSVTNSQAVVRSIDFSWPEQPDFAIAEVTFDKEKFEVRTEVHPREKASTISVTLLPGVPHGFFNSVVEIRTNSPEQPHYTLSVIGYVEHPIEIVSDRLAAGMLEPGKAVVLRAEFRAPYGGTISVQNANYVAGIPGEWRFLGEHNSIYVLEFELVSPKNSEEKVAIATLQVEASTGEYTRTLEIEGMGIVAQATCADERIQ